MICWRHETPVAATIASFDAAFTAGKRRIAADLERQVVVLALEAE